MNNTPWELAHDFQRSPRISSLFELQNPPIKGASRPENDYEETAREECDALLSQLTATRLGVLNAQVADVINDDKSVSQANSSPP